MQALAEFEQPAPDARFDRAKVMLDRLTPLAHQPGNLRLAGAARRPPSCRMAVGAPERPLEPLWKVMGEKAG